MMSRLGVVVAPSAAECDMVRESGLLLLCRWSVVLMILMRRLRANSCGLVERRAARKSKYWYLQRLVSEVAVKQKLAVENRRAKEGELN